MELDNREHLSALMDGELAAEPTRFLLRRLEHDPDLSATWSRWHLIRACLAADPARMSVPSADADFAARVAGAVAAVAPGASVMQPRRHWARYIGGGAIAASVAVAALMLNAPQSTAPHGASQVANASAASPQAEERPSGMLAAAGHADAAAASAPWLLSRQPTVLAAQPAAANVVYGAGLMQPEYLRRASFAQGAVMPYASADAAAPFTIVVVPPQASARVAAGAGR